MLRGDVPSPSPRHIGISSWTIIAIGSSLGCGFVVASEPVQRDREREGAAEQYWQEMNFGARVRYVVGDRDPDLVRLDRAAEQARGTLRERIDDRLREMPSDQLAKLNIAADRFADNRARGIDRTAREMSPSYAQAADREGSLKRHLLNADIGLAHMEHDANKTAADMHDRRKQMNVLQSLLHDFTPFKDKQLATMEKHAARLGELYAQAVSDRAEIASDHAAARGEKREAFSAIRDKAEHRFDMVSAMAERGRVLERQQQRERRRHEPLLICEQRD